MMKPVRTLGALSLLFLSFASSCQLYSLSKHLKVEEIASGTQFGMPDTCEKSTLHVILVQENKETFKTGFESLGDSHTILTCTSSKGHENFTCKEIRNPDRLRYNSSTDVLSADPSNAFDAILRDEQSRCPPYSDFSSQSLLLHTCHSGDVSSRELLDDEGQLGRVARLCSSEVPRTVVTRSNGYNLAPPLICLGSSVGYEIFKKTPNNHRGYRGKEFRSWRLSSVIFSFPLFFATAATGSPLKPPSHSTGAYISAQPPNPTTTPKHPLSPPPEPSFSPPEVGISSPPATPSSTETSPQSRNPSSSPSEGEASSQASKAEPSPTETASLPTETSTSGEAATDPIIKPFGWEPVAFSVGADGFALLIALGKGWPRTWALIAIAVYVFIDVNLSLEDQPDYLLGLIAWMNIGGFGVLFSFLDIHALWKQRGSGPDHGYGAYFFLVAILAVLFDLVYSSSIAAGDAKAFRKAMLNGLPLCWTISSIIIGRITEIDEQFHPRRRYHMRTADPETAVGEVPGEVTAPFLEPRQPIEVGMLTGRSTTWGDILKSTFGIGSLLPGITSSFLSRWRNSGAETGDDHELGLRQPGSGPAGSGQAEIGQQDSANDGQDDPNFAVGEDSDEASDPYPEHRHWLNSP